MGFCWGGIANIKKCPIEGIAMCRVGDRVFIGDCEFASFRCHGNVRNKGTPFIGDRETFRNDLLSTQNTFFTLDSLDRYDDIF